MSGASKSLWYEHIGDVSFLQKIQQGFQLYFDKKKKIKIIKIDKFMCHNHSDMTWMCYNVLIVPYAAFKYTWETHTAESGVRSTIIINLYCI